MVSLGRSAVFIVDLSGSDLTVTNTLQCLIFSENLNSKQSRTRFTFVHVLSKCCCCCLKRPNGGHGGKPQKSFVNFYCDDEGKDQLKKKIGLPDIIDCWSEIIGAVGECAMGSIFDAKSPIVGVMDTHARFVVFQMIPAFRITCRSVKVRAPEKAKAEIELFSRRSKGMTTEAEHTKNDK